MNSFYHLTNRVQVSEDLLISKYVSTGAIEKMTFCDFLKQEDIDPPWQYVL